MSEETNNSSHVTSDDRLFIKNGMIINNDHAFHGDIYIEDGFIKRVGCNLECPPHTRTLNASGRYVIPGGIDISTYFHGGIEGIRTAGDFTTGTKAALAGGTTTIFDVLVCPRGSSPLELYQKRRELADRQVCCDYGLVVTLTEINERIAEDIATLVLEKGVSCFQLHTGYRNVAMLDDDDLYDVLRLCRRLGAVAMVQPENGRIVARREEELIHQGVTGPEGHAAARSEESEAEAAGRVIILADQASCPVVLNPIGSLLAGQRLAAARREGKVAFAGCTPAHLLLKGRALLTPDWRRAAGHVTSPVLRSEESRQGLLGLVAAGDVAVTGSCHRAYRADQKALGRADFRGIPEGVNGVQERMAVLWEAAVKTGQIDPSKFVAITSSNAARMLNLYPRKGHIGVGSEADLVIWNADLGQHRKPSTEYLAGVDMNVYSHVSCSAGPETVISRGRVVLRPEDTTLEVAPGSGTFLSTPPFPQMLYTRIYAKEKASTPKAVIREAYTGPVVSIAAGDQPPPPTLTPTQKVVTHDNHPPHSDDRTTTPPGNRATKSGVRHMQESSFSFSGAQIDDRKPARSGIRTKQPPGGVSTNPFW